MITAASSVIRPGPADSGMLRHFVKRHHGKEKVETVHRSLTELLEETYGVMLLSGGCHQDCRSGGRVEFGCVRQTEAVYERQAGGGAVYGTSGFVLYRMR